MRFLNPQTGFAFKKIFGSEANRDIKARGLAADGFLSAISGAIGL